MRRFAEVLVLGLVVCVLSGCPGSSSVEDSGSPDSGADPDSGSNEGRDAGVDAGFDGGNADPCASGITHAGDVVIASPAEWTAFVQAGYTCIDGGLQIRALVGTNLTALDPPALKLKAVGELAIVSDGTLATASLPALLHTKILSSIATVLDLPLLSTVETRVEFYGPAAFRLPALRSAPGGIRIESASSVDLPELTNGGIQLTSSSAMTLNLPKMTEAPNGLVIQGNPQLTRISAPLLTSTREITITDDQVTAVTLPALREASDNVMVKARALTGLALPALVNVWGVLEIRGESLTSLTLPELVFVRRDFVVSNSALTQLLVPRLSTVGSLDGLVSLSSNPVLTDTDFPQLTSSAISVGLNPNLSRLNLPVLSTSTGVGVTGGTALTSLSFPQLATVSGSLYVAGPSLMQLSVPALTTVTGSFGFGIRNSLPAVSLPVLRTVGALDISDSATVTVSAPALTTADSIQMRRNPSLQTISAPSLMTARDLVIYSNASLRQCVVDALRAQLTSPPTGYLAMDNNGMPNTCP